MFISINEKKPYIGISLIYGFFGITAFGRQNAGFGSDCIKKDCPVYSSSIEVQ